MTIMGQKFHPEIRSFDHSEIRNRPEYVAVQRTLDALAKMEGNTLPPEYQSREGFLRLISEMSAVLPYSDACQDDDEDAHRWMVAPHKIARDGDYLTAHYRCLLHGREWTCRWAVKVMDLEN